MIGIPTQAWQRLGTLFCGLWFFCLLAEWVSRRQSGPHLELIREYVSSDNGRVEHAGQEVHS